MINYSAYAIVGIKLLYDNLYIKKRKRGCKHKVPKDAVFCPECGKKVYSEQDECHPEYHWGTDTFFGFDVVCHGQENDQDVYIGKVIAHDQDFDGSCGFCSPECFPDIDDIRKKLEEKLPAEFWDEDKFGVWTVLIMN